MKVKLIINGEEVEVTLTPEQIASIEAQKKPKRFEFKYPTYKTYFLAEIGVRSRFLGDDPHYLEHGRYRLTKEAAEQSLARNKRANRLEALAEQLGGLKEFKYLEKNYWIMREHDHNKWSIYYSDYSSSPERVYMTEECAIEICRMLNDGEFSLEGELP